MIKSLITYLARKLGYIIRRQHPASYKKGSTDFRQITPEGIMQAIHGVNIYSNFDYSAYPKDLQGWGSNSEAFERLISELKPKFIIEVGAWKGASAINMANHLKSIGGGTLLCIDTWLGALEFWENQQDNERFKSLQCRHGYPQVYYTFLANVCYSNCQDIIVPFPLHSASAALWLLRHGIQADMIYVDASHEEDDVYQDILDYYSIVRPGGVLFGDDWNWAGVQSAVKRFASENKLEITHLQDKWLLRK